MSTHALSDFLSIGCALLFGVLLGALAMRAWLMRCADWARERHLRELEALAAELRRNAVRHGIDQFQWGMEAGKRVARREMAAPRPHYFFQN